MTQSQPGNAYFPHIDGLRGVAILAVLLFHLDIALFSGGFIGVDVFFVISGFLITSHIRNLIEKDRFSLADFYMRRARRLLPALLFTLALTLIAGCILFSASQLEALGNSALQALFSVANIFLWLESGYFGTDAAMKPLLHMWSLSVEEQFYLVWPFYLLFFARRWSIAVLIIPGAISLVFAQYWLLHDSSMVFFMMPFRICEFALGAMAFYLYQSQIKPRALREGVSLIALALILTPVFIYQKETLFPGLSAMIPALGTALLIHSSVNTFTARVLGSSLPRFTGLISYSAYLLHWPLIVFYKYAVFPVLTLTAQLSIAVLSFGGGYLMYRFVETPFRKKSGHHFKISGKTLALTLLLSAGIITASSLIIIQSDGWPSRFGANQFTQEEIEEGMGDRFRLLSRLCKTRALDNCQVPSADKTNNVLIMGDSHAPDALNMFLTAFPEKHYVMDTLPGGCPPFIVEDQILLNPQHPDRQKCIDHNRKILSADYLKDFDQVIISVYFDWYRAENLAKTLEKIEALSDANIIVLGNYIVLNRGMAELVNQQIDIRHSQEFIKSFALYEQELKTLPSDRVVFISKKELLCDGDDIGSCRLFFNNKPFSWDEHHLSLQTGIYLGQKLKERYPEFPVPARLH